MIVSKRMSLLAVIVGCLVLSSCGNTIRGLGKDAANAVDATKDAGRRVGKAVN